MPSPVRTTIATLAVSVVLATPAVAQRWPQSPGGALAARAAAFMCPGTLTESEIADLDLYLARKRVAAQKKGGEAYQLLTELYPKLEAEYLERYRTPGSCTPAAREQAREAVKLVREELARLAD